MQEQHQELKPPEHLKWGPGYQPVECLCASQTSPSYPMDWSPGRIA